MLKTFLSLLFISSFSYANIVTNPSFENTLPGTTTIPTQWNNCSSGTPDVLGIANYFWGLTTPAADGSNYLGLYTISNSTFSERIGQPLSSNILPGTTYFGSVELFRGIGSEPWSGSAQFQVWAGTSACSEGVKLWESPPITNDNTWNTSAFSFNITPTIQNSAGYTHLMIKNVLASGSNPYTAVDNLQISSQPLALTNLELAGEWTNEVALLNWTLSANSPYESFEFQISRQGLYETEFKPIGNLKGISEQTGYTFTDDSPHAGANFYQLKVFDMLEGAYAYTKTVQVFVPYFEQANLYPNPVTNGKAQLALQAREKQDLRLQVIDTVGKTLQEQVVQLIPGLNTIPMDLSQLSSGTYSLVLKSPEGKAQSLLFLVH